MLSGETCWEGSSKEDWPPGASDFNILKYPTLFHNLARVAELEDAEDSKSFDREIVWVRVPPRAQSRPSQRLRTGNPQKTGPRKKSAERQAACCRLGLVEGEEVC